MFVKGNKNHSTRIAWWLFVHADFNPSTEKHPCRRHESYTIRHDCLFLINRSVTVEREKRWRWWWWWGGGELLLTATLDCRTGRERTSVWQASLGDRVSTRVNGRCCTRAEQVSLLFPQSNIAVKGEYNKSPMLIWKLRAHLYFTRTKFMSRSEIWNWGFTSSVTSNLSAN